MKILTWKQALEEFLIYLKLERSFSENSIEAYRRDVEKLKQYLDIQGLSELPPLSIQPQQLENMMAWLNELGLGSVTQSRILSGLKTFYKFFLLTDKIDVSPAELIEMPQKIQKIPDVLTVDEIIAMLEIIDLSQPNGHRNRAILEALYACGMRVSELCNLKLSNLFFEIGVIRIIGKGNQERLIPIGEDAMNFIKIYIQKIRTHQKPQKSAENIVFLNNRGTALSRIMIFNIVKEIAKQAHISKNVSPHTFRHSFATHLVEGGADLRVVQDLLGHATITTTEIYTHLNTDYLRETIILFHPREIQRRKKT